MGNKIMLSNYSSLMYGKLNVLHIFNYNLKGNLMSHFDQVFTQD